MKLRFISSKTANQFFFIANLSEWHFSCRLDYNKAWIKEMGALSNEEKKELAIFSNILQKYGFIYDKNGETKYIGKYFYRYSEKRAWEGLKKNITQKEFLEIKNAFTFFEKRFKKVWDPKELEKRTKILRNLTGNKKWKKLAQHISVLFGGFTPVKEIFVIALLSPLAGEGVTAAGSANIGGDHI